MFKQTRHILCMSYESAIIEYFKATGSSLRHSMDDELINLLSSRDCS